MKKLLILALLSTSMTTHAIEQSPHMKIQRLIEQQERLLSNIKTLQAQINASASEQQIAVLRNEQLSLEAALGLLANDFAQLVQQATTGQPPRASYMA